MFEIPVSTPQKAIIVQIEVISLQKDQLAINAFAEFKELCKSSGVQILDEISGKQATPIASNFLKKGKIEEIIYHGDHARVRLNLLGNKEFILKVPNSSSRLDIKRGNEINVGWNSYDARALDPKSI